MTVLKAAASAGLTNPVPVGQGGTGRIIYPMPKFTRALGKHVNKTGVVKILGLGESHVSGEGSGSGTLGLVNAWGGSFFQALNKLIGFDLGTISNDSLMGDNNIVAGGVLYPAYDTRTTFGSGWASDIGTNTIGGRFFVGQPSSGAFTFQPANAYDTIVVYYPTANGNISTALNVSNVQSGSLGNINELAAPSFLTQSFTTALGNSKISFTNNDATAGHLGYITGAYTYNSQIPGAISFQAGWLGALASQLNVSGYPYSTIPAIGKIAPDLTIIEEYLNDADAPTSPASYLANMQAIISEALISGDVISLFNFPANNSNYVANESAYQAVQQSLATQFSINVIDVSKIFGNTWANASTYGLTYDNLHPNAQGHAVYGQPAAEIIKLALSIGNN